MSLIIRYINSQITTIITKSYTNNLHAVMYFNKLYQFSRQIINFINRVWVVFRNMLMNYSSETRLEISASVL